MSWRHSWRTWQTMRGIERRLFLQAWFALLVADMVLCLHGYRAAEHWAVHRRAARWARVAAPERIAALVASAAHWHLRPMTCLRQALALKALLAHVGVESEICFGTTLCTGGVAAHAWVQVCGVPLGAQGQAASHFVLLRAREDIP